MPRYVCALLENFMVALGVMLGGAIIGSLYTLIQRQMPIAQCLVLAERLRIWAMVTALGGTFQSIRVIESSVLGREPYGLLKQAAYIMAAFLGAHTGYWLLRTFLGGRRW